MRDHGGQVEQGQALDGTVTLGAHVFIRGEEWLICQVDASRDGGRRRVCGDALELVRGCAAQFPNWFEGCNEVRVQFPVMRRHKLDTWCDTHGCVVFTACKGLVGVDLPGKGAHRESGCRTARAFFSQPPRGAADSMVENWGCP
ncbi:hypothetical protein RHOFW104T7_06650 [Rhodanobacter thiooxydans]|uniref:Uncharacterized protein n=1 Tax=Rhodanobacter thiooxydans TaxID=416169 RepID=A0A154QKR9_9GAMM|nr:hypothetical protein RHOFW104T7_06650 [Rhodanobacter thiooxydans]